MIKTKVFWMARKRRARRTPSRNRFAAFSGADLSPDQIEFGKAVADWKRENNTPNPSWEDVLHVLESLGYVVHLHTHSFRRRAQWFAGEMALYIRENRKPFPMFSEVLGVAISIGYRKVL